MLARLKQYNVLILSAYLSHIRTEWPPNSGELYLHFITSVVATGRDIVQVLQNSGQRHDLFDSIIQDGNKKGWSQAGDPLVPVQLQPVQLLHDMITRWDTMYYIWSGICVKCAWQVN
jgi:hypothetical protein